jgi:hypothetical protein
MAVPNEDAPFNMFERATSVSVRSENSQTAQDYIESQLALEAEAKEVLPYVGDIHLISVKQL